MAFKLFRKDDMVNSRVGQTSMYYILISNFKKMTFWNLLVPEVKRAAKYSNELANKIKDWSHPSIHLNSGLTNTFSVCQPLYGIQFVHPRMGSIFGINK